MGSSDSRGSRGERGYRLLVGPAIPRRVTGILARVDTQVHVELEPTPDGRQRMGDFTTPTRVIRILASLPPEVRWATWWHEVAHSWLEDSGVAALLSTEQREAICDAVATGLWRMMTPVVRHKKA